MKDMIFIVPPLTTNLYPQLATPVLLSAVKAAGFTGEQRDLNIEFYYYLNSFLKIETISNPRRQVKAPTLMELSTIYFAKEYFSELRKEDNYLAEYLNANHPMIEQLNPAMFLGFGFSELLDADPAIISRFAEDSKLNIYHDFYMKSETLKYAAENFRYIGLSLIAPTQFIPALSFIACVKKINPDVKIILGGAWTSMFTDDLITDKEFTKFFDVIVRGAGEVPLVDLLKAKSLEELKMIPSTYVNINGVVHSPEVKSVDAPIDNPTPDFSDLPMEKYILPRPLSLQITKGCYWNKCTFCVHTFANKSYRKRTYEDYIRDIDTLVEKYNPMTIVFTDLSHSPKILSDMSDWIINKGYRFRWFVFVRFEDALSFEILEKMKKAGCERIFFGLESVNEKTLQTINKGHKLSTVNRIIEDCNKLGLGMLATVMIGIPGETKEEAMTTINYVIENADKFSELMAEVFRMEKDTHLYNNPEKYGIVIDKKKPKRFDNCISFTNTPDALQTMDAYKLVNETIYSYFENKPNLIVKNKSINQAKMAGTFAEPSLFTASCESLFGKYDKRVSVKLRSTGGEILEIVE